ncbi:pilus assembly protein [Demequina sp. B12]|nr:TadE family protein [Demequina sp. B12]MDE0573593.1 pilus assembly protein [Demequina sp. B12]
MNRLRATRGNDQGSALVEFLGVAIMVVIIGLALIQLVFALHVRNTLQSTASAGAQHAALADRSPADGAARAIDLAQQSLGSISVEAEGREESISGVSVASVTVSAPVPLVGMWGAGRIAVTGRAIEEGRT